MTDRLEPLLEQGDIYAILSFFEGMNEKERSTYRVTVVEYISQAKERRETAYNRLAETIQDWDKFCELSRNHITSNRQCVQAEKVALLLCANLKDIAPKTNYRSKGETGNLLTIDALKQRSRSFCNNWAKNVLQNNWPWHYWQYIRELVKCGACDEPDDDTYHRGIIAGWKAVPPYFTDEQKEIDWREERKLIDIIKDDPALLDDAIWAIFRFNDYIIYSNKDEWHETFIALCNEGLVQRSKVLRLSIEALQFAPSSDRARFFLRLLKDVKPTLQEELEIKDMYLPLLESDVSTVMAYGLKSVKRLIKKDAYDAKVLFNILRPVIHHQTKTSTMQCLMLLEHIVSSTPSLVHDVLECIKMLLAHDHIDIQSKVVTLIVTCSDSNDSSLMQSLEPYQSSLPQSLKIQLGEHFVGHLEEDLDIHSHESSSLYLKELQSMIPEVRQALHVDALTTHYKNGTIDFQQIDVTRVQQHRIKQSNPLEPINSVKELIEEVLKTIESNDDILTFERVLSGISLLHDEKDHDFHRLTAPLKERAEKLWSQQNFFIHEPSSQITFLALTWLGVRKACFRWNGHFLHDALLLRTLYLCNRIKSNIILPLLSSPSHDDYSIDPLCLVERIRCWEKNHQTPDDIDMIIALLRLARSDRDQAAKASEGLVSEHALALRYALGDAVEPTNNKALWVAASRSRAPWESDDQISRHFSLEGPLLTSSVSASYAVSMRDKETPESRYVEINLNPVLQNRDRTIKKLTELRKFDPPRLILVKRNNETILADNYEPFIVSENNLDEKPFLQLVQAIDKDITSYYVEGYEEEKLPETYPAIIDFINNVPGLCLSNDILRDDMSQFPDDVSLISQAFLYASDKRAGTQSYPYLYRPCGDTPAQVRIAASLWPAYREPFIIAGIYELSGNIDWKCKAWRNKVFLEALLEPDVPLTPNGTTLLTLGLGARHPGEHVCAIDVASQAIYDGRLCPYDLGTAIHWLEFNEHYSYFPLKRFSKAMQTISEVSTLHSYFTMCAITHSLRGKLERIPRDFYSLLELLYELLLEHGEAIHHPDIIETLQSQKGSGKAARAARSMLVLEPKNHTAHKREILSEMILHRHAQAKSWSLLPL